MPLPRVVEFHISGGNTCLRTEGAGPRHLPIRAFGGIPHIVWADRPASRGGLATAEDTGMTLQRIYFIIIALLLSGAAQAQEVQLTLPGGTGQTAVFDASNNLVVVTRSVPAGYMQLYPAYDGSYRDPVVIVEGFDPLNQKLPPDVYAQVNPRGGIDTARAAGRSVWVVNLGDGGGAISANAKLVSLAIQQAAGYGGPTGTKVDLVGVSMGGLISRYALASDEQTGGASDGLVRLFVSGDSPQQGANGNPGFQELVLFQDDPAALPSVRSDASLSMLYTSVRTYSTNGCVLGALPSHTSYTASTAAHDWFYANINSLNGDGYPHKCRRVAISNGNWSALPYSVGSALFDCRTYATFPWRFKVCSETYYALSGDVAPGSLAGDFAPGNIREASFELDQHFVPCFIPTVSALDFRGGASMFDRTLTQAAAVNHSTIGQETNDVLLEELLGLGWRANVKIMPDGATANIRHRIVSAVFDGVVYVEEPDRVWGTAISGAVGSVLEGDVISVLGPMTTSGGERRIAASELAIEGQGQTVPGPLGMRCSDVGGGPVGLYTQSVSGGLGPNNLGLLVRCAGRVTGVSQDNSFFYLDDGSGRTDESGLRGIRVTLTGLRAGTVIVPPAQGADVAVTGVASIRSSPSGLQPVLRPRRQSDIVVFAD